MIIHLLFLLQLSLFSTFLPSVHGDTSLIQTTCNKTPYNNLCVSVLQSDARSSAAHDVERLAVIAAEKLSGEAKKTLKQVELLAGKDRRYKTCLDAYNIVVDADVPEILQATPGNPKFAEQGANDVGVEAESCGKSIKGSKSDIGDRNKFVHDWSLVVSAIVRLLL